MFVLVGLNECDKNLNLILFGCSRLRLKHLLQSLESSA
jgi:hypothetical protein